MSEDRYIQFTRWNATFLVAVLLFINPLAIVADPISAGALVWWASLAISAAISAASFGITYLLRPKAKPQDKGKLQGDIQLSNVGEDIPINEIYGGRQNDGLGGIRTGLTCVWASAIRKREVPLPAGGGGGGKGAPRPRTGTENKYFQDFAFLAGFGPLRVLDIKANTDLIYSDHTIDGQPTGTKYEAEAASRGTFAFVIADAECSGGQGVTTNSASGQCSIGNIVRTAEQEAHRSFFISYKSRAAFGDDRFTFAINDVAYTVTLPNSNDDVTNVMTTINLDVSTTNTLTFRITGGGDAPIIDFFTVGFPIFIPSDCPNPHNPLCDGALISGMKDANYTSPSATFNNGTLAVTGTLPDTALQYNYQPTVSSSGMISFTGPNGVKGRIYEGNATQTADPMLQAYFQARYPVIPGFDPTPAYRHRCLIVIEDFETTKFGGNMPNFTALLEHKTVKDLGAMYAIRAAKAGLKSTEYNFAALNDVVLRGFPITNVQAPRTEMEILNRIFDCDVIQNAAGIVEGVLPNYAVERQIPLNELDVVEMSGSAPNTDQPPPVAIERTVIPDEMLPDYLGVSFFDATDSGETRQKYASRQVTASSGRANIETGLVMLPVEAQKFATRDLQKQWAIKDPLKIKTFWKHCLVKPGTVIECEELDGAFTKMYVQNVQGLIPSVYEISGRSCNLDELAPRPFEIDIPLRDADRKQTLTRFVPPAVIIGTIIDLMKFRSSENVPGVYIAAAANETKYKWKGCTVAWQRGADWESLAGLPDQSTIGQTTGALGAVPGGWTPGAWDTTNSVQVQLKYGTLETKTDAEVLDRENVMVIGNEVIAFGIATLNSSVTNTWTVSRLQRRLNGVAVTHAATERAVLLNSAVKFVPLDVSEVGKTRNYAFLAGGQSAVDSLVTSVQFNSVGVSAYTVTNLTANRSLDVNDTTLNELADVVATVISDLRL